MTLSPSRLQSLLGADNVFVSRCAEVMCDVATSILAESGVGDTHASRVSYARRVIAAPRDTATAAAPFLAQTTNVANTITFEDNGILTTVTDAALLSQINASWNTLAGIDTGN